MSERAESLPSNLASRARRPSLRARFLLLWAVAVIAAATSFIVHLTLRFETVRLGYDVGAARREQRRLLESRRLLALESATLSQSDRIEAVARGSFGMDVPRPARIVAMGERRGARTLSGRAQ
jgi:cell division protein FtsL